MKFPQERDWFLYFCKVSWVASFKMGYDVKMSAFQIRTDCCDEINAYTYIMFRLHNFHSQLQCTIELNKRKMWTKYIKSKQTIYDMHHNETNVKRN